MSYIPYLIALLLIVVIIFVFPNIREPYESTQMILADRMRQGTIAKLLGIIGNRENVENHKNGGGTITKLINGVVTEQASTGPEQKAALVELKRLEAENKSVSEFDAEIQELRNDLDDLINNGDIEVIGDTDEIKAKRRQIADLERQKMTLSGYAPDNYDIEYHDSVEDIAAQVGYEETIMDPSMHLMDPNELRYKSSNFVPTYEDSVFLSRLSDISHARPVQNSADESAGFCHFHKNNPLLIEQKCRELDGSVCASTKCCVFLGGNTCVAGNKKGPTMKSNYNDPAISNNDHYYIDGRCYGNCPGNAPTL